MVVTDYNTRFLDKTGTDHLIDELKAYIDGVATGDIDLSSYVTKQELQDKLDDMHIDVDLSAYSTKDELAQAIDNIDLSAYATIQYVNEAVSNIPTGGGIDLTNYYTKEETYNKEEVDNLIPDVINGKDGKDGADGKNGEDGFSPTATVSKVGSTATITITDKNGTTTASISDGKDGTGGGSSAGSGEIYSKEEIEVGTWINGKTIYQKVYELSDFTASDTNGFKFYYVMDNNLVIDDIIDQNLIVRNDASTYVGSQYYTKIGTQTAVSGVVTAVNNNIINYGIMSKVKVYATYASIQIFLGTSYSAIEKIYLTLKYTKS